MTGGSPGSLVARLSGLHLQLLGLIILPFGVMLLAIALLGVRVHQDAMKQLIAERDVRGTRAAAAAIGQNLFHLRSSIRVVAEQHQAAASEAAPDPVGSGLLAEFDAGYLVLDRSGELLDSSRPVPPWEDEFRLDSHIDAGTLELELLAGEGSTLALLQAAESDVIAVGAFSIQNLARAALLSSMVSSQSSSAFLVDPAGNLLYYVGERPTMADLLQHPGVADGLRGESGSTFRETEGEERAVAFSPVPYSNWALVFEEPWQAVTSPLLDLSLLAPLAIAPALVITLLGLWFGARQVIQPLRELQEQAEGAALSADSFEGGSGGGIAEIRQLRRSLAEMASRIASSQAALQRYIAAITDAQEEERSRLARELHDETVQGLIAIDHRIQMLAMELGEEQHDLFEPLQALHAEVTHSVTELRRMTKALRPLYLEDLGLVPAIEMLVTELDRESSIDFELRRSGEPRRLGPQTELAIYRIVQEALSNVSRHSQAASAQVALEFSADELRVTVEDDGRGFDVPEVPISADHFGLMSMRERADLTGADLEIRSRSDQGTRVRLKLDLRSELHNSARQNA